MNAALAMVQAAKPENELEAALAVQMAATHELALTMLNRVRMHEYEPKEAFLYSNAAAKLMRSYAAQMTALDKLRRKGEQHITVEHLHVGPGAQAIVANNVRGGGHGQTIGQPGEGEHDITKQLSDHMRGQAPGWDALSVAPDAGPSPVPLTRRRAG